MKTERPAYLLPLPPLLKDLMASGRWSQPSDNLLATVVPFLHDPVDFLLTEERIRFESGHQLVDNPLFHQYRGSECAARPLPWLDADQYLFIAVNRFIGDDVGIALDYRTSYSDPRVVASDYSEVNGISYEWREVTATFSAFIDDIHV